MDDLFHDVFAESRLYGVLKDEIHPAPEEYFKEFLESHICVKGPVVELDEEIEVARLSLLPPGARPEKAMLLTPKPLIDSRFFSRIFMTSSRLMEFSYLLFFLTVFIP